ncbi:hypothetical protein E2C01_050715 [Portunus trituberculatus]|uniref:Mutator-like transposase domain-containing protein n=1 Tax=Portunus trituberculatus TaxID=210409 RepID=A0A5B7GGV6_PORTR|nr:hypothetical protein [Portunus trituberculatus]
MSNASGVLNIVRAIIEVYTGLIVDYAPISKICVQCKLHDLALRKGRITEEARVRKVENKKSHKEVCDINYEGTSSGMEAAATVTSYMGLDHNMRYTNFVTVIVGRSEL